MNSVDRLRPYLSECTVLLKNESDFRVKRPCKIALFGNGVRHTKKGGTGSGEVNSKYFNTVYQAFKEKGFVITTDLWLDSYDRCAKSSLKDFVKSVKKEAKAHHKFYLLYSMGKTRPEPEFDIEPDGDGEIAIYVLSRTSGEGSDRQFVKGDVLLTDSEISTICALNKRFEKFLLVLNVGGPVDLSPVMEVSNILLLSQLGVETSETLVDIVLGKTNPSGRLATTWSSCDNYPKIGDFGTWDDTYYNEGIYVGYRYFNTAQVKVLFPFGYGLSFTSFEQEVTSVSLNGSLVKIDVKVTNIGNEKGKDVVQVYTSLSEGKLNQSFCVLSAFAKSNELEAGSSEIISLTLDLIDLASYSSEDSSYILEKGDYVLLLGKNSRDVESFAVINLDETSIVKTVKALPKVDIKEIVLDRPKILIESLPVYKISSSSIKKTTVFYYQKEEDIDLSYLTDEELIRLSVGSFSSGFLANVIGEASSIVCGAAGETKAIKEKNISPIVMADGPAGLRLAKDYFVDKKGHHAIGKELFEGFNDFAGPLVRFLLRLITPRPKKKDKIYHQYCTAIPIGTAIAQSFNIDFAHLCGSIVASEMQEYKVNLFLAPAVNIHRNILCGRNFEYYSEDPLLSGKMASSITKAIQEHKGCGVTIKHFCANNQETNRYANNSIVSERALRDIYLKAFEIVVKESKPLAIMSSYNLLNGIHTSESKNLLEDILRCEFGFDGLVMTDWVVSLMDPGKESKYRGPIATSAIKAGNDIFMPGSQREIDDITLSLKEGRLTREELEHNVRRILKVIKRLEK